RRSGAGCTRKTPRCARSSCARRVPDSYADAARYRDQAATYDATRGASPSVARLLLRFLGPPHGRSVLDIAGGTGNYARAVTDAGFRVFVVDREPAML